MDALRPAGHVGDTCREVLQALADAQGQAALELIQLLGTLSGDPNPIAFFGTGTAACERAGKDFDKLLALHGPVFEGRPSDWEEAGARLLDMATLAMRAGPRAAATGTVEENGGDSGQPRITHTPIRGTTTRTTKAVGAGQRSVSSAVAAPLAAEATIEAEHHAQWSGQQARTPLLEAARLVATPYGEAAAAMLTSDGTISGSLGEKGEPLAN
jgi:hypothetical protein